MRFPSRRPSLCVDPPPLLTHLRAVQCGQPGAQGANAVLEVQGRWSAHISRPSAMSFADHGRSLVFRSGAAGHEHIYNLHIASGMITPVCPAPNVRRRVVF
jgi:hypothetical protein